MNNASIVGSVFNQINNHSKSVHFSNDLDLKSNKQH